VGQSGGCGSSTVTDPLVISKVNPKKLDCSDSIGPFNGVWSGVLNAADCAGANEGAKIQAAVNIASANGGGLVLDGVAQGSIQAITAELTIPQGVTVLLSAIYVYPAGSAALATPLVSLAGIGSSIQCEMPAPLMDPNGPPSGMPLGFPGVCGFDVDAVSGQFPSVVNLTSEGEVVRSLTIRATSKAAAGIDGCEVGQNCQYNERDIVDSNLIIGNISAGLGSPSLPTGWGIDFAETAAANVSDRNQIINNEVMYWGGTSSTGGGIRIQPGGAAGGLSSGVVEVRGNSLFNLTGPCIQAANPGGVSQYKFDPQITLNECFQPLKTFAGEAYYSVNDADGLLFANNHTEFYDCQTLAQCQNASGTTGAGGNIQLLLTNVSSGHVIDNTFTGNESNLAVGQSPIGGIDCAKCNYVIIAGNEIRNNQTYGTTYTGGGTMDSYGPNNWSQGPAGAGTELASLNGLLWACLTYSNISLNGYCGTGPNPGANPNDLTIVGNNFGSPSEWFGTNTVCTANGLMGSTVAACCTGAGTGTCNNHRLTRDQTTNRWNFTGSNDSTLINNACKGTSVLAAGVGTFSLDCIGLIPSPNCTSQDQTAAHVPLTVGPVSNGRSFVDGVENTTTTLTSATAAFVAGDVGRLVTGAGIPTIIGSPSTYTYIASVTNGTTVVLSQAATATATGVTVGLYALVNLTNGTGTDVASTVCQ
jgi:hypothetical protein